MTESSISSTKNGLPQLNIVSFIALWLVASCGAALFWIQLQQTNDTSNIRYGLVISLLFFNNLNILIACCEIALGKHIKLIQSDYQKFKENRF